MKRNRRIPQWVVAVGVLLVLLDTAAFIGYFGVENLMEALAFTGRFTGALFVVAAFLMFLAAVAALDHWFLKRYPPSGVIVLIGTGIALLANFTLAISIVRDKEWDFHLLHWSILAIGSVWALLATWRTDIAIPAPKKIGVALLVSGAVAIGNFVYGQLYEPYERPQSVRLDVSIGDPIQRPDAAIMSFPVSVTLGNDGSVGLWILDGGYLVEGENVDLRKGKPTVDMRTEVAAAAVERRYISYWTTETRQFAQMVRIMPDLGEWLDPGDESKLTHMIDVPVESAFDNLRITARVIIARKDRMDIDGNFSVERSWENKGLNNEGRDFLEYRTGLRENNAVADFTREPRVVVIREYVDGGYYASVVPRGKAFASLDSEYEEMADRYGMILIDTAGTEKPVPTTRPRRR